jgi:phage shock protein PspC (stress-responsive transcriptional regulator)
MKTTVNINISGQSFIIDEDAFQHLSVYLNNIKSRFSNENEAKEVVEDIEARIAELFITSSTASRSVVSMQQVEQVIAKLGKPEDIFMEDESSESKSNFNAGASQSNHQNRSNARLFRNPDDKKVSGLLSGISAYFGLADPSILRIIFVVLCVFSAGTLAIPLIVIYIGLSAILPLANTASEKLQMRGEDVNLNNIKRSVQQEMSRGVNVARTSGQQFFDSVIDVIKSIFMFLPKLISGFTLAISLVLLFMMILFFFVSDVGAVSELAGLLFHTPLDAHLSSIGLFLFFGIPCVSIIYYSLRGMLGSSVRKPGLSWVLFGLWMIGVVLVAFEGVKTTKQFAKGSNIVKTETIDSLSSDTLILVANNKQGLDHSGTNINIASYKIDGFSMLEKKIYMQEVELSIVRGTDKVELTSTSEARGANEEEAHVKASNILTNYSFAKNTLLIDNFISFPVSDKYRFQKVKMQLKLPIGKVIYLDPSTEDLIYDIKNVTNTYDDYMVSHYWIMTEQGLKCLDKDFSKIKEANIENDGEEEDSMDAHLEKEVKEVNMKLNKEGIDIHVDKDGSSEDANISIKSDGKDGAHIIVKKNEKVIIKE